MTEVTRGLRAVSEHPGWTYVRELLQGMERAAVEDIQNSRSVDAAVHTLQVAHLFRATLNRYAEKEII